MKKRLCALFVAILISNGLLAKDYIKLANKNTSAFIKKMHNEKNLLLCGSGGAMMNDVESIFLSFNLVGCRSIEEARALYVEVAEEFLALINADEKLRPFLHNYPFTIDNLELRLTLVDESHHFQPSLAYVSYIKRHGLLYFDGYDQTKGGLYDLYQEPYSEAVKIVKSTQALGFLIQ